VGAVLLAGGQGSRLGIAGPKGLFSVGGKTLFRHFCEKVPQGVPIAIMTSPLNSDETIAYFKENNYFDREIHFFSQEVAPFLDDDKNPLDLKGPNGNGSFFRSFVKAELSDLFLQKGIRYVTVSNVDNYLAEPVDCNMLSVMMLQNLDALVQCVEKEEGDPPMGAIIEEGERVRVVEYTDLKPDASYRYAYSGQIGFSLSFVMEMAGRDLPIHWVRKEHQGQWIWKGEQFIFDALPFAKRVKTFPVLKRTHYAPIKTRQCAAMIEQSLR
jgi:UDP-N-acetylglucosamine/UDP-N-acetylgalactosamine diphosphorylase